MEMKFIQRSYTVNEENSVSIDEEKENVRVFTLVIILLLKEIII